MITTLKRQSYSRIITYRQILSSPSIHHITSSVHQIKLKDRINKGFSLSLLSHFYCLSREVHIWPFQSNLSNPKQLIIIQSYLICTLKLNEEMLIKLKCVLSSNIQFSSSLPFSKLKDFKQQSKKAAFQKKDETNSEKGEEGSPDESSRVKKFFSRAQQSQQTAFFSNSELQGKGIQKDNENRSSPTVGKQGPMKSIPKVASVNSEKAREKIFAIVRKASETAKEGKRGIDKEKSGKRDIHHAIDDYLADNHFNAFEVGVCLPLIEQNILNFIATIDSEIFERFSPPTFELVFQKLLGAENYKQAVEQLVSLHGRYSKSTQEYRSGVRHALLDSLFISKLGQNLVEKMRVVIQILKLNSLTSKKTRSFLFEETRKQNFTWMFNLSRTILNKSTSQDKAVFYSLFHQYYTHDIIFREQFEESHLFFNVLAKFYYSNEKRLEDFLDIMEKVLRNKNYPYLGKLRNSFLDFASKGDCLPPFKVSEKLSDYFQSCFRLKKKNSAFMVVLMGEAAKHPEYLMRLQSDSKVFGLQNLDKEYLKITEELYLSLPRSYLFRPTTLPYLNKQVRRISVNGSLPMKVKALIKLGEKEKALDLVNSNLIENRAIMKARRILLHVLTRYIEEVDKQFETISLKKMGSEIKNFLRNCDTNYLLQVHDKLENHELMIAQLLPSNKQEKHGFWEATLYMERAEELVKLQVTGDIDRMKQNPIFREVGPSEKPIDYTYKRGDLPVNQMAQLYYQYQLEEGTVAPPPQQEQPQEEVSEVQAPEASEQIAVDASKTEQNSTEAAGDTIPEGQVAVEVTQAVQAVAQKSTPEGQVLAEATQQLQTVAEVASESQSSEQPSSTSHQSNEVKVEKAEEAVKVGEGEKVVAEEDQILQWTEGKNMFPANLRPLGFNLQYQLAYLEKFMKPLLDENYKMEKEMIKFMIKFQSLVVQAKTMNSIDLNLRLREYEQTIAPYPHLIQVMKCFNLWKWNFTESNYKEFKDNYYEMIKFDLEPKQESYNLKRTSPIGPQQTEKSNSIIIGPKLVEDLFLTRENLFREAEQIVKTAPLPIVEELMEWGVINDQPMAIYLGQKIAMTTNQTIEHSTALKVSNYLSYRRTLPHSRIEECKRCLRVVGKIDRERIYDFNKDYHHILVKKHFQRYINNTYSKFGFDSIDHFCRLTPQPSKFPTTRQQTLESANNRTVL